jgi:hypothetical protein
VNRAECVRQYRNIIDVYRVLASDDDPRSAIDLVRALDIQSYYRSCMSSSRPVSSSAERTYSTDACMPSGHPASSSAERTHSTDELSDESSSASCDTHSVSLSSRPSEPSESEVASHKRMPAHDDQSDSSRGKRNSSFSATAGVRRSSRSSLLSVLSHLTLVWGSCHRCYSSILILHPQDSRLKLSFALTLASGPRPNKPRSWSEDRRPAACFFFRTGR